MTIPYFYEKNILNNASHFILSEETSRHCVQVLRMKIGEKLHLTDGKGNLFTASIAEADKKNCAVKIESLNFTTKKSKKICIAVSLIKNTTRFEWFLEKATEIGVTEIIPLLCSRTERQHFRFDRMNNILIAAMLQSQQTWLPVLQMPTSLQIVLDQSSYIQKLIAHCEENEKKTLGQLKIENSVQMLIGPEGDFTSDEIKSAIQKNYLPVSLGNTRLRTETAGITAAALLINL